MPCSVVVPQATNWLHRVGAAALLLSFLGCGGGGGGEDSDPVTCTSTTFERALIAPSGGDVYFDQAASSCSMLEIGVLVSNLSGIFTVGFDLTYPGALMQFDSYTLGPLLQKGNPQNDIFVKVTEVAGGLQIVMTRLGSDGPVTAVGSEALINLRFTRVSAGAGAIDFHTGAGSTVGESIYDDSGVQLPAIFAPGHGGMATVP